MYTWRADWRGRGFLVGAIMRTVAAGLVLWLGLAAPAAGQAIVGVVVDTTAGTGVAGAEVAAFQAGARATVVADEAGRFRLGLRSGAFMLRVRALGYAEVLSPVLTVEEGDTLQATVHLAAAPVTLSAINATATSQRPQFGIAGFHERLRSRARTGGWGHFVDSTAVERSPTLMHLFRRIPFAHVTSGAVSLRPECSDAIYVIDGMVVSTWTAGDLDALFAPQDVAGIEVYRSDVGVPAHLLFAQIGQPQGSTRCGIIAIWLKH